MRGMQVNREPFILNMFASDAHFIPLTIHIFRIFLSLPQAIHTLYVYVRVICTLEDVIGYREIENSNIDVEKF